MKPLPEMIVAIARSAGVPDHAIHMTAAPISCAEDAAIREQVFTEQHVHGHDDSEQITGSAAAPRAFVLEDFSADYHATDCLISLLAHLTDEDVQLVTVSDRRAELRELRRLKDHISQSKSPLMQSIVGGVVTLAEYQLETAEQIAREERIDPYTGQA